MVISKVTEYAHSFVGTVYFYGGNNPITGFDCSGFISEILKAFGVLHYHEDLSAQELFTRLCKSYSPSEKKEGAILFFGYNATSISHVAYGFSENLMIEAGGGDSVTISHEIAAKKNAFVRIRPIAMRKDFIGAICPSYIDVG